MVKATKNLSVEEKRAIENLLTQDFRQEKQDELYQNYQKSLLNEQNGYLKFSSNVNELKRLIED